MITLTFEVGDTVYKLTVDEARKLWLELDRMFGDRQNPIPYWPAPHNPIPYSPPPGCPSMPSHPTYPEVWCCGAKTDYPFERAHGRRSITSEIMGW